MNMDANVVILYSGGADSRYLLELAKDLGKIPHCVLVNYGQLHDEELGFAVAHLDEDNISYQIVNLSGLQIDSGLTGDGIRGTYEGVNEWHVPARNMMFVSIATSIAEGNCVEEVWLGADYSDRAALFPDCYQEWFIKVNELLEINGSLKVKLVGPCMGLTKEMIVTYLDKKGITLEEMHSGYGKLDIAS